MATWASLWFARYKKKAKKKNKISILLENYLDNWNLIWKDSLEIYLISFRFVNQHHGQRKLNFPIGQTQKRNLLWNCLVSWNQSCQAWGIKVHQAFPKHVRIFEINDVLTDFLIYKLFAIVIMLWKWNLSRRYIEKTFV